MPTTKRQRKPGSNGPLPKSFRIPGRLLVLEAEPRIWRSRQAPEWMVKVDGKWKRLAVVLAEALLCRSLYRVEQLY